MKTVLTIAGTDPDGGAGIPADLKTFVALGVYGTSVVTAVVAQNTVGVQGVFVMPAKFVSQQIDSVMTDLDVRVWKIGMLANEEIISVVAERARFYKIKHVIIDPVMKAKTGGSLLEKQANKTFVEKLLPLCLVLTPNKDEAEILSGISINSLETTKQAAKIIYKMGAKNVVIKGGHLNKIKSEKLKVKSFSATDFLFDGKKFTEFSSPRIKTSNTHGTGCTFASAIAAEIAKGKRIEEAVSFAKRYLTEAIRSGKNIKIGHGNGPIDHFFNSKS